MTPPLSSRATQPSRSTASTARYIAAGLLLGIACGLFFGDYCGALEPIGQAYIGLLQMAALPYVVFSLTGKLGRLNLQEAGRLGLVGALILLGFWAVGVLVIVAVTQILPAAQAASFFSAPEVATSEEQQPFVSMFIPTNVFRSLSDGVVPAVVVFCLLFGMALSAMPGKGGLLDLLDLCAETMARISLWLVKLAPLGLFALTAAAAGTLQMDELVRLQAYLVMFLIACLFVAFALLPLVIHALTEIRYRDFLRAAWDPVLTAFATGKLLVVLPLIVEKCDQLLGASGDEATSPDSSTASVMVPLAYPFPHLGKTLGFVFISFAAWYVGRDLSFVETADVGGVGAVSSFASPLVSMPFLLDRYRLPQDLMSLFLLPGFFTMRMADVVGVVHLMTLTILSTRALQGRLIFRPQALAMACLGSVLVLAGMIVTGRMYLASVHMDRQSDRRILALEIPHPCPDVTVFAERPETTPASGAATSALDRIRLHDVLRVGYHPDHLPYSYLNDQGQLVGLDVELMHHLATRLQMRLEFIPWTYASVIEQLDSGEIDLAIGGLVLTPERALRAGFTEPYQDATLAMVVPDRQRDRFVSWDLLMNDRDVRLGVVSPDLMAPARRQLPACEIVPIESISQFFEGQVTDIDGLIIAAEEGAAWNVLYPAYTVVMPEPIIRRQVGIAARQGDASWLRFLDRWLEFERSDGSLDRLRAFWIEGDGTHVQPPRWSVIRDVLHWIQ